MNNPWEDMFSGNRLSLADFQKLDGLVQLNDAGKIEFILTLFYPLSVFDGLFFVGKAAELGNLASLIVIREHYKDSKFYSMFGSTAATAAIKEEQWEIADYLLSEKVDPDDMMSTAAFNGKYELVRKLSSAGIHLPVSPPAEILKNLVAKSREDRRAASEILKKMSNK